MTTKRAASSLPRRRAPRPAWAGNRRRPSRVEIVRMDQDPEGRALLANPAFVKLLEERRASGPKLTLAEVWRRLEQRDRRRFAARIAAIVAGDARQGRLRGGELAAIGRRLAARLWSEREEIVELLGATWEGPRPGVMPADRLSIVGVKWLEDYWLRVTLSDGSTIERDLRPLFIRARGVLRPLRSVESFRKAFVNPDLDTVCWPGNLDVAPETVLWGGGSPPNDMRIRPPKRARCMGRGRLRVVP